MKFLLIFNYFNLFYCLNNFLYIMFDDLRPELSIYSNNFIISPNFERLAKKSVVFDYAFCQVIFIFIFFIFLLFLF